MRVTSQALALGDALDDAQQLRFRLARARAAVMQRELQRAAADLVAAAAAATAVGGTAQAEVLLVRGDLEQKAGNLPASRLTLADALEAYRAAGDERGVGATLRTIGLTEMFSDDIEASRAAFSEGLATSRRLGDRRGEAWALQHLAWVSYTTGDVVAAEDWANSSLEAFREIGDAGGLGWAMALLAFVRYHQGRFDEAEAMATLLVDEAGQRGDRWAEGMMRNLLGLLALWTGRTHLAVEHGQAALGRFKAMGDWYGLLLAVGVLGRALVACGRVDEGFAVFEDAAATIDKLDIQTARDLVVINLTCAAAQAGTVSRSPIKPATADFDRALQLGWTEREVALALLALQSGDAATAHSILERVAVDEQASGFGGAALVLARAATGDAEGAVAAAQVVGGGERATYSDRVLALLGGALASAHVGVEDRARSMLGAAERLVDKTDDALLGVVVHLAGARVSEHFGADVTDELRRVEAALAAMGITEPGWDTAFSLMLD